MRTSDITIDIYNNVNYYNFNRIPRRSCSALSAHPRRTRVWQIGFSTYNQPHSANVPHIRSISIILGYYARREEYRTIDDRTHVHIIYNFIVLSVVLKIWSKVIEVSYADRNQFSCLFILFVSVVAMIKVNYTR